MSKKCSLCFILCVVKCLSAEPTVTIISTEPIAFNQTIGLNFPINGSTQETDYFSAQNLFPLSANGLYYMYRRSTVNENSDTSTKWDYSDEWQTFAIEVADSFSSTARWRYMRQYQGAYFAFGDWQDLNIGNNTLNISGVNHPRQIGFQIDGNVSFSNLTHSYESGSDSISLSNQSDDSQETNDSDSSDGSDNTPGSDGTENTNSPNTDQSPNIILIISDDQRWDATSYMQSKLASEGKIARFPWLDTPHFDSFQASSINFINAFTTFSTCSPSRATMLTGLYPHEHGVTDNSTPFPVNSITFATELKNENYITGYFGKWHHGRQTERPGFDKVVTYHGQGTYSDTHLYDGNGNYIRQTSSNEWIDDVCTEEAINFIESNVNNKFLLVLGFKTPHEPFTPPSRTSTDYFNEIAETVPNLNINPVALPFGTPNSQTRHEQNRKYMRTIKGIDQCIGNLFEKLDELNISDRTAIIYVSDNGFFRGEHKLWDKRAAYEESIRIPLIIKYPRHYSNAKEVKEIALNLDIAPTILDIAGIEIPEIMQGESLLKLITEEESVNWRSSFFYQYNHDPEFPNANVRPCIALRHENGLKLIINEEDSLYEGDWRELYNLKNDPYEINNLALGNSYTLKEMQKILENKINKTAFMKVLGINKEKGVINLKLGKKYNFSVDFSYNLNDWLPISEISRGNNLSGNVNIDIPNSNNKTFIRVKYGQN